MKKSVFNYCFILLSVVLFSCSSQVRITDSWRSDNFSSIDGKKVLVVNKFKSEGLRQRAERDIVLALREKGIEADEAFSAYPYLNVSIDRSTQEVRHIVESFIEAGYGAVIITDLKNKKNQSSTTRLTEADEYHPTLTSYMNSPSVDQPPLRTPGPNGMEETTENFDEVYELETMTYNISKGEEQVLARESIEVIDPEKIKEVLNKYAAKIAKQFNK